MDDHGFMVPIPHWPKGADIDGETLRTGVAEFKNKARNAKQNRGKW